MLIKGIIDEDFVNYKKPAMFIGCHTCTFKCDREAGERVCQNDTLAKEPDIFISNTDLIKRYIGNSISKAIVFGGLEPFDDMQDILMFICNLRWLGCRDDMVIYTGYTEKEVMAMKEFKWLLELGDIVIKFGRFIPGQKKHFDEVLGVYLSSDNQYAKRFVGGAWFR